MKLTVEERLELLLHVKWTVKQFDCQLTRELCELLEREADLLNRGRPEKSMEGAWACEFVYRGSRRGRDRVHTDALEGCCVTVTAWCLCLCCRAASTGLRKRIYDMFLQFVETPEFNPEAARFQRVPSRTASVAASE